MAHATGELMLAGETVSDENLMRFLLQVQAAFRASDIDLLRQKFVLPFVVYSAAGILLIKDDAGFQDHSNRYLEALHSNGVEMSDCEIIDVDAVNNRRFRATARWTDFAASGKPVSRSLVRYFLIEERTEIWKIEMMEFVELPFSISEAERVIH